MKNISKISAVLLASTLAGCGDNSERPLDGKSVVLVHGAWMGAWAWNDVAADLEARGAVVTAVELPGHGTDQTPIPQVSLRSYVDTVETAIDAARPPVMLVAHSMGGIVATQAADERGAKVDRIAYVTAFVPKDGDTLLGLSMQDADSQLGAALTIDMQSGVASVAADKISAIFCADCDATAGAALTAHYRDEPLAPFAQPVTLAAGGWATLPKFYLYADDDRAISPANQKKMTADLTWTAKASLATSHSPFLSLPTAVADTLTTFFTTSVR